MRNAARGAGRLARPATTTNPHPATGNAPLILSGARVVLPTGTAPTARSSSRARASRRPRPRQRPRVDLIRPLVVPGFVDIHNHGGGGASFTSGAVDDVLKGSTPTALHGTTTVVASTVTGEMDFLVQRAGCSPSSPSRATSPASTSRAPSSPRAARARTARPCCATPTPPTSAS